MHMSGVRVNIVIETVGKQRVVRLEREMDGHWRRASAPTARGVGRFSTAATRESGTCGG